jgi:hypothetical protein
VPLDGTHTWRVLEITSLSPPNDRVCMTLRWTETDSKFQAPRFPRLSARLRARARARVAWQADILAPVAPLLAAAPGSWSAATVKSSAFVRSCTNRYDAWTMVGSWPRSDPKWMRISTGPRPMKTNRTPPICGTVLVLNAVDHGRKLAK